MALSAVPVERAGLASGVVNLARLVGITVGIAVMGTVMALVSGDATTGPGFADGVRAGVLTGGVVEFLGAVVVVGYTGRRRSEHTEPIEEVCHA
jgi:hypothetical protein